MPLSEEDKKYWLSLETKRTILIDMEYHDGKSNKFLRLSNFPYVMPVGDAWNGEENLIYEDILDKVPSISNSIDSSSTVGSINIFNTIGELDHLLYLSTVVGFSLKIYIGDSTWNREDFIQIVDAVISAVSSSDPNKIRIDLKDVKEKLNKTLQEDKITLEYWSDLMDRVATLPFSNPILSASGLRLYDRNKAVLPDSTENTPIPICLGKCFNVEPILVDSFNHIYMLHDGGKGIQGISEVRSNGVPLTKDSGIREARIAPIDSAIQIGDTITSESNPQVTATISNVGLLTNLIDGVTGNPIFDLFVQTVHYRIHDELKDFRNLEELRVNNNANPSVIEVLDIIPQFEIDNTIGIIRLLDNPSGTQITCDVVGQNGRSDKVPDTAKPLVNNSAAYMLEWLLLEKGGFSFNDIDEASFIGSGFKNISTLGSYYSSEGQLSAALDDIVQSVGGFIRISNDGTCKIQIIRLDDPSESEPKYFINSDDIVEGGISVIKVEEPVKSITLNYRKNWKTQDEGSLAASVTDASSRFYSINKLNSFKNEFSVLRSNTGLSVEIYPDLKDKDIVNSLIYEKSDTAEELGRRINLRKSRRRILKVIVSGLPFISNIGDVIKITSNSFGLTKGRNAVVIKTTESPNDNRSVLELWL